MAVKHNILYLYGGIIEEGNRQYTFSDFYSLGTFSLIIHIIIYINLIFLILINYFIYSLFHLIKIINALTRAHAILKVL